MEEGRSPGYGMQTFQMHVEQLKDGGIRSR